MMDTVKLSFLAHPGGWAGVGVGMPALFRRFRLGGEGCRLGGEGPPGEEWLGLEKGLDVELEVKDVAVLPRRETCWPRLGQQSVCIVLRRMSSTHTMHCAAPPPPPQLLSLRRAVHGTRWSSTGELAPGPYKRWGKRLAGGC